MSDPEFKPKLGRPRSSDSSERITRQIIKATTRHRASRSPWAGALTRRPVAELARGKGALYGLSPPTPGQRRVIVKLRIARHGTADLGAARAHLHYIQRDGVTREGGAGQLYDRETDGIDASDFLADQKRDTYQFRLIVAPEDGARLADLKPFVRDLMARMESDLHTKLEWVAVDHFNTGHPHTHIVIAGHDDRGKDLVIARHYISHGIRERAQDLVTLELGPELAFERVLKLANEVKAERFTSLDRSLIKKACENVLTISALASEETGRLALRIGRLRTLEKLGLAQERRAGVWVLDSGIEPKLRAMGDRGDIMVTMHRAMKAAGHERGASDFAIFSGAAKASPVIGRVAEIGFTDELTERRYLVVDGTDGRVHYAETDKLQAGQIPEPGMIVALSGGGKGKVRNAKVEIVSYWELERLPQVVGETWLDRTIVADQRPAIRERGFGAEVSKALQAREEHLIANGLAVSETPGTITPNRKLLAELSLRGRSALVARLETEIDLPHRPLSEGDRFQGRHVKTVDMPTGRLAVIANKREFTTIPWRSELMQMRGRDVTLAVQDRAITISMARVLQRDLGLSR